MSETIFDLLQTPQFVQKVASGAGRRAARHITSVAEVFALTKVAELDVAVGAAVRELTIDLAPPVFAEPQSLSVYCSAMRNTFRLTQGVTDLTLILPKNTPGDIFLLIHLHNLRLFKTNLPHRTIAQFLGRHKSLTHLVLGACGLVDKCPLAALDLRHVTSLECDASCVGAIAHGNLTYVTIENRDPDRYMSSLLRDLAAPASSLYSLTIDFFVDDTDILQSIALVSPRLKKLKLIEHPSRLPGRRASTRRAFNDYLSWHRGLRKLSVLEELALRTSAPLVRVSGDLAAERRLIMGWVTGIRTDRTKGMRQG